MSEKVKLVIEIPKYYVKHPQDYTCLAECVRRGTPLDDMKAEIKTFTIAEKGEYDIGFNDAVLKCFNVLDNISKESEGV